MSSNGETKNILVISQYYNPTENYDYKIKEFIDNLSSQDHNIIVITNKKLLDNDYTEETINNVKLYYVDQDNYSGNGEWNYVFYNISFLWNAMKIGFQLQDKIDIVISTIPTGFTAIVGKVVAAYKGAKFYFEVKEKWVENALALNYIKNGTPIYKAAIMVENWINKNCEQLPDNF
jgi:hypothetical protein